MTTPIRTAADRRRLLTEYQHALEEAARLTSLHLGLVSGCAVPEDFFGLATPVSGAADLAIEESEECVLDAAAELIIAGMAAGVFSGGIDGVYARVRALGRELDRRGH